MMLTTRTQLQEQLLEVEGLVLELGEQTTTDIARIEAVIGSDAQRAEALLAGSVTEDKLRTRLEQLCLDIMLLQQPLVADDLRLVTGAFRVVSDLSHSDALARDAALLALEISDDRDEELVMLLSQLVHHASQQIKNATDVFLHPDLERIEVLIQNDEKLNGGFDKALERAVHLVKEGGMQARTCVELLMVAKYFERMGDLAKRIAAWGRYRITGEHVIDKASVHQ